MPWIVNDGPPATSQRAAPSVQGKAQDVPLCAPQKWVPRSRLIEWSEVPRRGNERAAPLPHASIRRLVSGFSPLQLAHAGPRTGLTRTTEVEPGAMMRMGGDTTHKKTQDLCKRAKTKKRFLFLCVICTEINK